MESHLDPREEINMDIQALNKRLETCPPNKEEQRQIIFEWALLVAQRFRGAMPAGVDREQLRAQIAGMSLIEAAKHIRGRLSCGLREAYDVALQLMRGE